MIPNPMGDCPDFRKDSSITIKELLDLGYLEGDCYPCMYYDPISSSCCKEGGDNRNDEMQ